ncbi:MAG: TraR/DksA family transcriptional regulator [Desulfobulbaceae bacterium]
MQQQCHPWPMDQLQLSREVLFVEIYTKIRFTIGLELGFLQNSKKETKESMHGVIDSEYFKKRLEERLAAIIDGQEEKKGENPVELDQARVGRLSRMDAMQQQAVAQEAARLAGLERQRIEVALKRIDAGEYGYCIFCGEEIAEGRLRFDPSVLTCIACARAAEK